MSLALRVVRVVAVSPPDDAGAPAPATRVAMACVLTVTLLLFLLPAAVALFALLSG